MSQFVPKVKGYRQVQSEPADTRPPRRQTTSRFVCKVLGNWFRSWLQELPYFARWNPISLSLSRIAFVGIYTAILTSLYLRGHLHIPGISPTVPSSILTAVTFFTSSVYARAESRRTQNIREFNMLLQALMSLALALHYRLGRSAGQSAAVAPKHKKRQPAEKDDLGRAPVTEHKMPDAHKVRGLIERLKRILDIHVKAGDKGRILDTHTLPPGRPVCSQACRFDVQCVHTACLCEEGLLKLKESNCIRTAMFSMQLQLSRLRLEVFELAGNQAGYFEPMLFELEQSVRRVSGHYVPEISRVVTIFAYTSVWAWTIYLPFALIPTTQGYISVLATCFSSVFVWAITESAGGIDDIYAQEETVSDHDVQGSVGHTVQILDTILAAYPQS